MSEVDPHFREDPEIEALLVRAEQGDQAAWSELFARFRPASRRFISLRMDRQLLSRIDISDVLQETEIEVFRRISDFMQRRPMPFQLWINKTAYERLLLLRRDHVETAKRAVTREHRLPERSSLVLAKRLLASGITPSEHLGRKELARKVHSALAVLADTDREILLMRFVEGLSHVEIASILGIDPAAARKRQGRALVRLHSALLESGITESQL